MGEQDFDLMEIRDQVIAEAELLANTTVKQINEHLHRNVVAIRDHIKHQVDTVIMPSLQSLYTEADTQMDITEKFTQDRILFLDKLMKDTPRVIDSWVLVPSEQGIVELKYNISDEIIFNRLDRGTMHNPMFRLSNSIQQFVKQLIDTEFGVT